MLKMPFVLLPAVFAVSLCFAQEQAAPVNEAVPDQAATETFSGKVDYLVLADPGSDMPGRLAIVDDGGIKLVFIVKPRTPVSTADGTSISLSKIKKDNLVTVDYITALKNTKIVQSIKVTQQ